MKILWVVNIPLGPLGEALNGKRENGLWMEALLDEFKGKEEYQITVATASRIKRPLKVEEGGVSYCALPDDYPIFYNHKKKKNLALWKSFIEDTKPDIIQVFGTEFAHALCALKVKGDIPAVIYMQGVMRAVSEFYLAGIPYKEAKKTRTFRDFIKRDGIVDQQKKFALAAKREEEMLSIAKNVISENEWCNAYLKAAYSDVKIYSLPLSLNKVFSEYVWNLNGAEKRSVICTASGYPIKGLHVVLKAAGLLKKEFPDVKLYVPGSPVTAGSGIKNRLKKSGYVKYVENLIENLNLKENVVWLGNLSQKDLAEEYSEKRVFVMPSAIENHSSSLKEAMTVGVPCVSSYVGGIPEYLSHGENGLLYRFEEYEVLAERIKAIFTDDALASRLSENAKIKMKGLHDGDVLFKKITDIYDGILKEKV